MAGVAVAAAAADQAQWALRSVLTDRAVVDSLLGPAPAKARDNFFLAAQHLGILQLGVDQAKTIAEMLHQAQEQKPLGSSLRIAVAQIDALRTQLGAIAPTVQTALAGLAGKCRRE